VGRIITFLAVVFLWIPVSAHDEIDSNGNAIDPYHLIDAHLSFLGHEDEENIANTIRIIDLYWEMNGGRPEKSADIDEFRGDHSLELNYPELSQLDVFKYCEWVREFFGEDSAEEIILSAINLYDILFTNHGLVPIAHAGQNHAKKPKNQFQEICEAAKKLQKYRATRDWNDVRQLFLKLQLCILQRLCMGACAKGDIESARWLNDLVVDFMNPLSRYLDGGDLSDYPGWADVKDDIALFQAFYDERPNAMDANNLPQQLAVILANQIDKRGLKLKTAIWMANVHIRFDLEYALERNGVGDDIDWNCVGRQVARCEQIWLSDFEIAGGIIAGSEWQGVHRQFS
jgi:hypothetical protein